MKHFLNPRIHAQATLNTHAHGTGLQANSMHTGSMQTGPMHISVFQRAGKNVSIVLSVLANVVGGSLVISAMLLLPQIIAGLIK